MKLRNKKTGEIIDVYKGQILLHYNQGKKTIQFKSIEELEEWEDYEEPKDYYFIRSESLTIGYSPISNTRSCRNRKEIGNYFETEEEAEKAIEKLKAWKRLKDKGFRFNGKEVFSEGLLEIDGVLPALERADNAERLKIIDGLDLLFGGEE